MENNTPTVEELQATVAKLNADLEAATKERDDAKAHAASIESTWADEKVTRALTDALTRSGVKPEFMEDAMLRAKPLFTVDAKTGAVVTKADAKDTVPGQDAAGWVQGELKAKRPMYWPTSTGGGSTGGGVILDRSAGLDACFDPTSPKYNFTKQCEFEVRFGADAADRARRKFSGRGTR